MQVVPEQAIDTSSTSYDLSWPARAWRHISHLWHHMHISHRGAFSIERLAAFDDYCRDTSSLRSLLRCCLLPIPALVAGVLMEFIPLRDPREGWKANYAAWVREFLTSSLLGVGLILQTSQFLPQVALTPLRILCIALLASVGTIIPRLLLSSYWMFPVPFGSIMFGPVYFGLLLAIVFVIVRKHLHDPAFVHDLCHQVHILSIQCFFIIVYGAFFTLYYNVTPSKQPFVVLGLPIVKFTMQQAVAWASSYTGEFMPGITVFTIEVFNALYVAKCLQSAGSPITNILLIAFDIFHGVRSFHRMNKKLSKLSQMIELKTNNTIFEHVVATCRLPNVLQSARETHEIRVRSLLQLHLSVRGSDIIHQLVQFQSPPPAQAPTVSLIADSIPPMSPFGQVSVLPSKEYLSFCDKIIRRILRAPAKHKT